MTSEEGDIVGWVRVRTDEQFLQGVNTAVA